MITIATIDYHWLPLSLATNWYYCQPLLTTAYHCLPLLATGYHRLPLITIGWQLLPLGTNGYHWPPLATTGYHWPPLITTGHHLPPLATVTPPNLVRGPIWQVKELAEGFFDKMRNADPAEPLTNALTITRQVR